VLGTNQRSRARLISVNSVPGNREEQSAYRSKLAGVSGSLSLIAAVCMVHDIHSRSIAICLDGKQAMFAVSEDCSVRGLAPVSCASRLRSAYGHPSKSPWVADQGSLEVDQGESGQRSLSRLSRQVSTGQYLYGQYGKDVLELSE
jgi:hypothetical protein